MGIRFVQELLGHTSLVATQKYLHVATANLQITYAEFHPHGAKCWGRIYMRMRKRYRKALEGRNPAVELETFNALCLRYNAAQRLFNE